jgi:hypothetical protein
VTRQNTKNDNVETTGTIDLNQSRGTKKRASYCSASAAASADAAIAVATCVFNVSWPPRNA